MPNRICPVCSHVKATRLLAVPKAPLFPVCDPGYQGQKLVALEFVSCDRCGHIFNCLDTSDAMRDLVTQDIPWFVQVNHAQLAVTENVVEWIGHANISGKRVLEIGGAAGALTLALADHALEVISVEPNKGFVREKPSNSNIHYVEGIFPDDAPPGRYDLIVCQQVICQIPDPADFLTHIRKALSPEGLLYLSTESAESVVNNISLSSFQVQAQNIFSESSFMALAEHIGFSIVSWKIAGKNFRVLASTADSHHIEETLRPRPDFMEDFAERLESQYQKGSDALKNINGPIAIYGTSGGAQAFLGLFPEFEDIVIAFDDAKEFDGLEISGNVSTIPITRPSKKLLNEIETVIICSYQHDLSIQKKLRELNFNGDIYSMRTGPDAGAEGRPQSLFH